MITHLNLPKILGSLYDKDAEYAMTETHASGRAGVMPSPRRGPAGRWQLLGQFADPSTDNIRQFYIYKWVLGQPTPAPVPSKES